MGAQEPALKDADKVHCFPKKMDKTNLKRKHFDDSGDEETMLIAGSKDEDIAGASASGGEEDHDEDDEDDEEEEEDEEEDEEEYDDEYNEKQKKLLSLTDSEFVDKYWRSTSKPRDKLVIAEFAANKRLSLERTIYKGVLAAGYLQEYISQFPQIDFEKPTFLGAKTLANHIFEVETTEDAEEFWNFQTKEGITPSEMKIRCLFSTVTKEILWKNLIRAPTRDVSKANKAAGDVKRSAKFIGRPQLHEMESAFIAAVFSKLNELDFIYKNMPIRFALAPTASEEVTLETDSTPGLLIQYVFLPDGVLADGFVKIKLNIPEGFDFGDYKQFWLDMNIDSIGYLPIQVKSSQAEFGKTANFDVPVRKYNGMMLFCGAGTFEPLQRVDNADSLGEFKIKYLMFVDDPALHNKINFHPVLGIAEKQAGIAEHYFGIDQVSNFIHMAEFFTETILNSINSKTFEELAYCSIENGYYGSVIEKKSIRLLLCALRAVEPDTDILFPRRQNECVDFFIKFKNEKKVLAVSMKSASASTKLFETTRKINLNAEKNVQLVDAIIAYDTFDNVSFYCMHKTNFGCKSFCWSLSSNSATGKKKRGPKPQNTTLVTTFAGVVQWTTPCVCNAKQKGRSRGYKQCLDCDFTINVEEATKLYNLMVSKAP